MQGCCVCRVLLTCPLMCRRRHGWAQTILQERGACLGWLRLNWKARHAASTLKMGCGAATMRKGEGKTAVLRAPSLAETKECTRVPSMHLNTSNNRWHSRSLQPSREHDTPPNTPPVPLPACTGSGSHTPLTFLVVLSSSSCSSSRSSSCCCCLLLHFVALLHQGQGSVLFGLTAAASTLIMTGSNLLQGVPATTVSNHSDAVFRTIC